MKRAERREAGKRKNEERRTRRAGNEAGVPGGGSGGELPDQPPRRRMRDAPHEYRAGAAPALAKKVLSGVRGEERDSRGRPCARQK